MSDSEDKNTIAVGRARRAGVLVLLLFAVAVATLLIGASAAAAGTFNVRQCDTAANGNAQPSAPDLSSWHLNGSYFQGYNVCGSEWGFGLGVYSDNPAPRHSWGGYAFIVPSGMRFLSGYAEVDFWNTGGYEPRLSVSDGSSHSYIRTASTDGFKGFSWGAPFTYTRQLWLWETCVRQSSDWCQGQNAPDKALGRHFSFVVEDYTAPSSGSLSGSLVSGGWKNGSYSVGYSGSDAQSGVQYLDLYVRGSHQAQQQSSCPGVGGGWYGHFRPCPSSTSMSRTFSVSGNGFAQGANQVEGCARDLASGGSRNVSCTTATVNVDTVAPTAVNALAVAEGEAWRPLNDYDISWSNPSQAHAPIAGAAYRLTRIGGGYDSGRQYVSGANRQAINDLTVPSAGEYQLKVWLRDEAGNESEANASTATLRFDPTVPPASEAQFNGWLRRHDFEHVAEWERIDAGRLGPSGLDGYAVSITQDPVSDPCVTDGDPGAACAAGEINNKGIADTSMPIADLPEGEWYAHVVPVTGAGVKAAEVRHTPLPVDKTDPVGAIATLPTGWTNRDVTVSVSASDSLSGMEPKAAGHPMDPQPRTCLQVGERPPECEPDADLTRVITDEGEHTVRYFARDLAGNENSGTPDPQYPAKQNHTPPKAMVRIDKTPPALAFLTARDVEDPAKVMVEVTDQLSGLANGEIELRREGSSGSWFAVESKRDGGRILARPPDDLDHGRYEFRASATDHAGNSGATYRRADGSRMVEELPLKEGVRLSVRAEGKPRKCKRRSGKKGRGRKGRCKGGGKRKPIVSKKVRYGKPIRISGTLSSVGETPLRGRELTVTEQLAEGAVQAIRTRTVKTDSEGRYSIGLPAGPSRTVKVSYGGDPRYLPTTSSATNIRVAPKVLAFSSPQTVPETKPIRFRGRVGTAGTTMGAQGKRVELQYLKSPGNWRTIDSAQTNGAGRFSARYGLRANYVRRTKVRFRVLVPPERSWPYAGTARSRARTTVILP